MKSIKKNVLRHFLFISLGLSIATIAIAATYEAPGKPGQPCIQNFDVDFCEINYTAPESDGGSPIKQYLIESKIISWGWDNWEKRGTSYNLEYKVENMIEGTKAIFRVSAENKAGFGEPSDPSDPVVFKPRR